MYEDTTRKVSIIKEIMVDKTTGPRQRIIKSRKHGARPPEQQQKRGPYKKNNKLTNNKMNITNIIMTGASDNLGGYDYRATFILRPSAYI